MHFSTIVLPFYLLAIAASSPIQEADAGNSVTRSDDSGLDAPANGKCTFRLSYLLANDSTVPIVHEVLVFTGSKNADIEDRFGNLSQNQDTCTRLTLIQSSQC